MCVGHFCFVWCIKKKEFLSGVKDGTTNYCSNWLVVKTKESLQPKMGGVGVGGGGGWVWTCEPAEEWTERFEFRAAAAGHRLDRHPQQQEEAALLLLLLLFLFPPWNEVTQDNRLVTVLRASRDFSVSFSVLPSRFYLAVQISTAIRFLKAWFELLWIELGKTGIIEFIFWAADLSRLEFPGNEIKVERKTKEECCQKKKVAFSFDDWSNTSCPSVYWPIGQMTVLLGFFIR